MTAEQLFEFVINTFDAEPAITQSRMFGSRGLKAGGKVFAMLVKGRLVVKLPRDRVDALVRAGQGAHFDPGHGKVMKEWVAVEPTTRRKWVALAQTAKDFVTASR